ncbi:MAG: hypothetical protein R3C05_02310 [Pirellulaceae bacterium]
MKTARLRHTLLIVPLLIGSCSIAAEPFYAKLQQPCHVQGTAIPLEKLARSLSQTHGINIWLDRRIDPTQPIDLPEWGSNRWNLRC